MITEKDLLKWGFTKHEDYGGVTAIFFLPSGTEWVGYDLHRHALSVRYNGSYIYLSAVTTKRKPDQALRLLGLPSIDKLNTIKK